MTDQHKEVMEEFIVGLLVKRNGLDRMAILKQLNRILQKAGFSQYFRDDAKTGFLLIFCDFCGEPVDDFGECLGCGKNNLQIANKVPAVPDENRRGERKNGNRMEKTEE